MEIFNYLNFELWNFKVECEKSPQGFKRFQKWLHWKKTAEREFHKQKKTLRIFVNRVNDSIEKITLRSPHREKIPNRSFIKLWLPKDILKKKNTYKGLL